MLDAFCVCEGDSVRRRAVLVLVSTPEQMATKFPLHLLVLFRGYWPQKGASEILFLV